MAIVEGPFQNITDVTGGRPFYVSCTVQSSDPNTEVNFIRYKDKEGAELNFDIGSQYRFVAPEDGLAIVLPKSGSSVAFPFTGKFTNPVSGLKKVGFFSVGPDGLRALVIYNARAIQYVGSFRSDRARFSYVVLDGPDAGLYVASINSEGQVTVSAYAPYLDLVLGTDAFTPKPDALASEIELTGQPIAAYMSDPGTGPAEIRFGISTFVTMSSDSIVVAPRVLRISEVYPTGSSTVETLVTDLTPVIRLTPSLAVLSVTVNSSIPTIPSVGGEFRYVPVSSDTGAIRIPSRRVSGVDKDLFLSSSLTFVGEVDSLPTRDSIQYFNNSVLRVIPKTRTSGAFGYIETLRKFKLIDFYSQAIRDETVEYESLRNSIPITRVVTADGNDVMLALSSIFYTTKSTRLFTGRYKRENSFKRRTAITASVPTQMYYGAFL